MMLNTEEQGELNLLVVQYLEKVNSKLTDKFSRAANIPPVSERDLTKTSSHSLEAVVKFFLETQNGASSKRKFPDEDESLQKTEKKQKKEKDRTTGGMHVEPEPELVKKTESKKKQAEKKTVFIRNIPKKFNFEKHRGRFEAFGKTLGFTNSGKGFGFVTFTSEEAAHTCIETLNSTEIDGNVVKMNIARGNQGKADDEATSCKLFVHGVKQEVTEKELIEVFSKFGSVVNCFNPGKGFAFVTFHCKEQAEAAVNSLQGTEVFGNILSLNISKPKENTEVKANSKKKKNKKKEKGAVGTEQSRLFVKNVDKDADMEEMKKVFQAHGDVKDIYNPGKGFIFVSYSNSIEAQNAANALDGEHVNGQNIQCNIAKFKKGAKKKK